MWARSVVRPASLGRWTGPPSPVLAIHRAFHGTSRVFDADPPDPVGQVDRPTANQKPKTQRNTTQSNATERLKNLMKEAAQPGSADHPPVKLSRPSKRSKGQVSSRGLDDELVSATQDVAQHLSPGQPERKVKVESDLLRHLKSAQHQSNASLEDLMADIKVEKKPQESESEKRFGRSKESGGSARELTSEQRDFLERRRRQRRDQLGGPREDDRQGGIRDSVVLPPGLFARQPLGIFTEPVPENPDRSHEVPMPTWDACQMREVKIMNWRPPRNVIEDMIDLTEKQVLWQFPIDNEQGINYDELEPFHHHVFLERHLEPWCPKEGPIRHFMELVCVGLQKNAHMTVAKKLETIEWFKEYLMNEEKQEIFRLSEMQ
ncbi:hypothetical protein TCAL_00587 [Tigriopus californicus]|uniref:Small ribosomal subunit protein mS31 n=1 Tax=Tigriopus californicus TaxID=6832 RepID=A0A553PCG2_TIGCA|nr:small ribosomal subunit protein mS31-like [Tigriopus californicus]TRY75359.1 hypothetical protein TCAL_00587 [Tigriopus californicus]